MSCTLARHRALRITVICWCFWLGSSALVAHAQMTANVLLRVRMIKVGPVAGSAFTIEVDRRQYLITAKHVVASLKGPEDVIEICKNDTQCTPIKVKVLRCDEPIDIAVLLPPAQLTVSFPFEPTAQGMLFGQDVYFLGFPYRLGTQSTVSYQIPIIKKAILSGRINEGGALKFLFDGQNNPGFSGGPVVFRNVNQPGYSFNVAAVIEGFKSEVSPVFKPEQIEAAQATDQDKALGRLVPRPDGTYLRLNPTDDVVQSNTGIIEAYNIQYAVDLIRKKSSRAPGLRTV